MSHQAPDTVLITVDAPGVGDIPPNPDVGYIYEIGINGEGYMLDDSPVDPNTLPDVVVPSLDPPRLATSDTPFAQAVERYTFEAFHDWEGGAGQRWLNREESTSKGFWDSEGVDPFTTRGELGLLPAMAESLAETYAGLRLAVVGDDMYAVTGADELTRLIGSTGAWDTPFSISDGDAVVVSDLASDGQYWYAATGEGIIRGTTSDPAANWSAQLAAGVRWAGGRICAAVVASGSTPNRFTTLDELGAEEVAGGHLTLDAGHTIVLGGATRGHVYFGSYVGDQGQIYAWQLGVDSEGAFHVPYVAWDMPQGLIPTAVYTAGGEVWIRAFKPEGPSAGEVNIYRLVPGSDTPFLVAELGVTDREGDFTEVADLVLFSWEDSTGDAALGAISLRSGGYARWLLSHQTGSIPSLVEWQGRVAVAVSGVGVYIEETDAWETAGWLETSVVDGASSLGKVLDTLTLEASPLNTDQSVEISYSTDAGATFSSAGTLSTAGAKRQVFEVGVRTGSFAVRFDLAGPGTSRTIVHSVQPKYHPLGLRDQVIVLQVKAFDEMTGLNGALLPDSAPGRGVEIYRTLLNMGQSRILFQDADWHITGVAEVWEVVSVRAKRRAIYDASQGHNMLSAVVELTLRKSWS